MSRRTEQRWIAKKLQCESCGHIQIIQRRPSKNRSPGHIKHLYCPECQKRTGHIEQNCQ